MEKDFIKSLLYMAVGFASSNREILDEFKKNLTEKGKMTEEEGKKIIENIVNRSKEIKEEIMHKIENASQQIYETLNLATHKEIEEIKARLDVLEGKSPAVKKGEPNSNSSNSPSDKKK